MSMLNIIIAGGGTAGWMAANLMIKKWASLPVKITLVESPDIGTIGVGEGSTPSLKRFFEMLEVPEKDWMPACNATYKVGIKFNGWSPESGIESYRHPFISQTDVFTQRAFEVNCRTRRHGLDTHTVPEDFLINGALAKNNLGPITPDNFPFKMEYGYHFDSALLGNYLQKLACQRGVQHVCKRILTAKQHQDGRIQSLMCEDGTELAGDFFVDCTGFKSLLLQETLNVPFNSYQDCLFNDAAVAVQTPGSEDIANETEATALSHGWCWRIPLQNRVGNGYVYSSKHLNQHDAEQEFRIHLGIQDSDLTCRHLKMKVGQVARHWEKNCLAIGLLQGFMEPLEATALHLVQICIEMFIIKFEEGQFSEQFQAQFNRFARDRFDGVRDYIVAHYKLNTRTDSEYWQQNRENQQLSPSLVRLLDVWFKRGEISKEIQRQDIAKHWDNISWHCLLSGYGAYPALAPNQPGKGDLYLEQHIEQYVQGCALNFKPHHDNLVALRHD
ncbi:tryptophan halogenase family protein [Planctobacterium marinum]|uniref:tryptophan halogenase family protein n=1 Tax=Planctobacterium marinum TaxID=1631968 RepID=UPI001E54B615|nr:tryptophan halogenase family protein [Planctobacterium marinum]MCC2604316.1 tryptophan 7-halogenase [Planctobacterium marinum]